jgi:NADH-quinone oxidoreductase subunit L
MLGHACLRTLQFLRAPSLLHDYRTMENAIGAHLPRMIGPWSRLVPDHWRPWLYRLALERGYLDAWLTDYLVRPFLRFFQWCDSLERRWSDFLSGGNFRRSNKRPPNPASLEDLA